MSDEGQYRIEAELGELSLTVSGDDDEWVRETFDDEWAGRMEEAEHMAKALRKSYNGEYR